MEEHQVSLTLAIYFKPNQPIFDHLSGIPFLTNMEQERLKDLVLERHSQSEVAYNPVGGTGKSPKFVSPATNKAPVDVPEEEKEFLEGIW